MQKIIYPKLTPHTDMGFVRIGGPGLANSMIISARAYIFAQKNNYDFINPTWGKISIGPYIRKELDKRSYFNLFNSFGISGFKKIYYLILFTLGNKKIIKIDEMGKIFFEELKENYKITTEYFNKIIKKEKVKDIENLNFTNIIGIHVRFGDYKNIKLDTSVYYYKNLILKIKEIYRDKYQFYVFSDAQDEELKELLCIKNVKKVFWGNALADLIALSKTKLIVGSNSTFSGLAAFLNQTPIIFPTRHFGSVLNHPEKEFVLDEKSNEIFLEKFLTHTL